MSLDYDLSRLSTNLINDDHEIILLHSSDNASKLFHGILPKKCGNWGVERNLEVEDKMAQYLKFE